MAQRPRFARHGTLVAGTVTEITIAWDVRTILVKAHGTGHINGNINADTDPTVDGDDTFRVDAGSVLVYDSERNVAIDVIRLISAGTPGYSVEAF